MNQVQQVASHRDFSEQQCREAKLHFMNRYHPTHPEQQALANKVALPLKYRISRPIRRTFFPKNVT